MRNNRKTFLRIIIMLIVVEQLRSIEEQRSVTQVVNINKDLSFAFLMDRRTIDGHKFTQFMYKCQKDYDYLKAKMEQGLIKLLFPNFHELNKLTATDIKMLKAAARVSHRIISGYRVILEYFGIALVNSRTGELTRGHYWPEGKYRLLNLDWVTTMLRGLC